MIDNIIEKIKQETNYSVFKIMIMYLKDNFRYKIDLDEFYDYKFYIIEDSLKKSFITKKDNVKLIKRYNSKVENYKIRNRNILYNVFKDYVKREYFILDDRNVFEFKEFLKGKKKITVRKINGYMKEDISLSNHRFDKLYLTLFQNNVRLAEECMLEHKSYNKYLLKSDFSINFIILNGKIILETFKTKGVHNIINDRKFNNKKIPYLNEMENISLEMFNALDNLNYLYFEFFVSTNGIELIGINDIVPIIQNKEALYNGRGYKEKIKEFLE